MSPTRRWIAPRPSSRPGEDSSPHSSTHSSTFPQRQSLTLREAKIFNELFEQIFDKGPSSATRATKGFLSRTSIGPRLGEGPRSVDTLFGKLRRRSKRYHDPTEAHLVVEQQRLIMESFNTDRELLDWAIKNVFNNDDPNSFPAKVPVSRRLAQPQKARLATTYPAAQPSHAHNSTPPDNDDAARQFAIQSTVYPHLLASLISLFRDKFRDPHTALSIFSAARHISVPSYVFGCTTAVYNELLVTLWTAFRDLEGIVEALNEMRANGVIPDEQTRRVTLRVKREAMLLASGQLLRARLSDSSPTSHPEHETEQVWFDVPVEHPTRLLVAQMESFTAPSQIAHPSLHSGVAARNSWKKQALPERRDHEPEDGLELR